MSTFFRRVSRDSHLLSKYAGDANALQTGGVPRLAKRVARRVVTRKAFGLARSRGWWR